MKHFFYFMISVTLAVNPAVRLAAQKAENGNGLKKIAQCWLDVLNRHDLEALTRLYDDSVQAESSGWEDIKRGPLAIKEAYGRYFLSSPDLRYTLTNLVISDHALVLEYSSAGTMQHLENQVPAYMGGKKYILRNCTRMDIREGKIFKQVTYFDQVSFLRQMGFFDQR